MFVVDASVWVSEIVVEDSHHELTSQLFRRVAVEEIQLLAAPISVLSEVAGAVSRRTGQPRIGHQVIGSLMNMPNVRFLSVNDELGLLGAQLAADLSLRGADALYVAVSQHLGIPLVTWDEQQRSRSGLVIESYTPIEAWGRNH